MKPLLLTLAMLCTGLCNAQTGTPRDFDFWIGRWEVFRYGTDTMVGMSHIEYGFNGTAIKEHYQSTRFSYYGESYSDYNRSTQKWEQHWVDNAGAVLNIEGGWVAGIEGSRDDGQMILGSCVDTTCNRVVWSNLDDGTVRQEWFQSTVGTEKWNKVYDGHYKRIDRKDDVLIAVNGLERLGNIRDFTISFDGDEAYTTVQNTTESSRTIARLGIQDGDVIRSRIALFSGEYKDLEPMLSPDGMSLYFVSNRPRPGASEAADYNIWKVNRAHRDSVWSEPMILNEIVNTTRDEFYPSITSGGVLYFTSVKEDDGGKDNIYRCDLNHKPLIVEKLPEQINTEGYEYNSFIAPDESYLIFGGYRRADGLGSGDLYISYRNADGNWSETRNLGATLNSEQMDYCPYVVNNVLFFTSKRDNTSTQNTNNLEQIIFNNNQYSNGSSRIYRADLEDILDK